MTQRNASTYDTSVNNVKTYVYLINKYLNNFKSSYVMFQQEQSYFQVWLHKKGMIGLINSMSLNFSPDQKIKLKLQELEVQSSFQNSYIESLNTHGKQEFQNGGQNIECKLQQDLQVSKGQKFNENDSQSEEQESSKNTNMKQSKRGPYKSYTLEQKQRAVKMLLQDHYSVIQISRQLKIPCKNIKRWSTQGIQRKKGGGRKKFSPQTQRAVASYFKKKYPAQSQISYEQVQATARNLSKDQNFKASRGWVVKFVERQNLKNLFRFI